MPIIAVLGIAKAAFQRLSGDYNRVVTEWAPMADIFNRTREKCSMNRRKFRIRLTIIALLAAILTAVSVRPATAEGPYSRRTPIVEAFEKNKDAVVQISSATVVPRRDDFFSWGWDEFFFPKPPRHRADVVPSLGSGFVIHKDGYLVTNAHVVRRALDIKITMTDGSEYHAEKVAEDVSADLAILKIDTESPVPTVTLGGSDDLYIGETVLAIGNPFGYEHTLTEGIVSARHRDVEVSDLVLKEMVQISAPINFGNSGGPLLNINGEVIGINTAINRAAQGIGFAIPINQLRENIPSMLNIDTRYRIDFGLKLSEIANDNRPGLQVVSVRPGSAAAAAGFAAGDIVTAVDSVPVGSVIDFYLDMLEMRVGRTLSFAVSSDGKAARNIGLTLKQRPKPDGPKLAKKLLGIKIAPLNRQVKSRYKIVGDAGNVLVSSVTKGSSAHNAGIQPGDIIIELDGTKTKDIESLGLELELVEEGQLVELTINRTEKMGFFLGVTQHVFTLRCQGYPTDSPEHIDL